MPGRGRKVRPQATGRKPTGRYLLYENQRAVFSHPSRRPGDPPLTSSQQESDIVQSHHLGVNSYIVKPVDFAQFADAVRQLGCYWLLLNQPPVH